MSKKLYIYERLDVCNPGSDAYHEGGGLVVITAGLVDDVVKPGTGCLPEDARSVECRLPVADFIIVIPDDTPDALIPFPDSGCC